MAHFPSIVIISIKDICARNLDMNLIRSVLDSFDPVLSDASRIVSIHKTAVSLNGQKVPKGLNTWRVMSLLFCNFKSGVIC